MIDVIAGIFCVYKKCLDCNETIWLRFSIFQYKIFSMDLKKDDYVGSNSQSILCIIYFSMHHEQHVV